MAYNCKWVEISIAVVIVVFAMWKTAASQWILVIAALVLLAHALMCKKLSTCGSKTVYNPLPKTIPKSASKKKKKK